MSRTLSGIDVSNWQGRPDWAAADKRIGFAMCKASEGAGYADPDYADSIRALRRAGKPRGSYHYPGDGGTAAEAHWYARCAQRLNGEMQALDFEGPVLSVRDPVAWAQRWLTDVAALTGNLPLIYMSAAVEHAHDWTPVIRLGAGLWLASWTDVKPKPGPWPFVIMWQHSATGTDPGIAGNVDQDVFYGDAATWRAYAINKKTPTGKGGTVKTTPAKTKPKATKAPAKPKPKPRAEPKPKQATVRHAAPASYTVKPGDTLTRIARTHQATVRELVVLNEAAYPSLSVNPGLIKVGWKLSVGR